MSQFRDLRASLDAAHSLGPAARTNGTANGAGVDLQGYNGALVVFHFGTWTDGTHTPKVQESDDNSAYTDVAAADLVGPALAAVSSGAGSNTMQRVGYRGAKRYIRSVMTTTGATTGALSASSVARGKPAQAPLA